MNGNDVSLRHYFETRLRDLDRLFTAKFEALDRANTKADLLLAQYKLDSNEYRVTFLPLTTWQSEHRQIVTRVDSDYKQLLDKLEAHVQLNDQRMTEMDRQRGVIRDDVATLVNRKGYVNISVGLSVLAFLVMAISLYPSLR